MFVKQILVALSVSCFSLVGFVSTASAVSPGGLKSDSGRVEAYSSVTYTLTCYGGMEAAAIVNGDGDTDLDVYVRDSRGNLVALDDDPTDYCVVSWVPTWTGTFTIEIVNRGRVFNRYVIGTN